MPDQLRIYALRIPSYISDHQLGALFHQVSPERQAKASRFVKKADTLRSLAAELLLCRVALPKAGIEAAFPLFTYNQYGKPGLTHNPDIHFNLSHSGQLVVCAVDSLPVGIDVEEIQPIDMSIAQNCCTQEELTWLTASKAEDRLKCFYELWTIKESYLKAKGEGLASPLDSFSIHKSAEGGITIFPTPEKCFFRQYQIDNKYQLAVCAGHDSFPAEVLWADLRELTKL